MIHNIVETFRRIKLESIKFRLSSLILAIPFSILSYIFTYYLSMQEHTPLIWLIWGSFLGFIYAYLMINILLIFQHRRVILFILSIYFLYVCVQLLSLKVFNTFITQDYIALILNNGLENFLKQSGVSQIQAFWIMLTVFLIVVGIYFIFNRITKLSKYYFVSLDTLQILLVFIVIDFFATSIIVHTHIKNIFHTYQKAIPWRPYIDMNTLDQIYYTVEDNKLENSNISLVHNVQKLPNIVMFMAESLRGDMTTPNIMPYLNTLEGSLYKNNFSTANGTFYSLFTILYGLFPNYYWNTIQETDATLLSIMKKLGYEKSLYSSKSLSWNSLDVFLGQNDFDTYIIKDKNLTYQDDKEIIQYFKQNFNRSNKAEFHLIITNSSHYDYSVPPQKKYKFEPSTRGEYNLFSPSQSEKKEIINRYKNSIAYIDNLLQKTIHTIQKQGEWNNTIFIFFGDHGEELYEEGHIGHIGKLNYYQTSAALFIHAPNDQKSIEVHKTTSHLDIVPTILELLKQYGVEYQKPHWLKGYNIHSNSYKERAVFSTSVKNSYDKDILHSYSLAYQNLVFVPKKIEMDSKKQELIARYIEDFLAFEQ